MLNNQECISYIGILFAVDGDGQCRDLVSRNIPPTRRFGAHMIDQHWAQAFAREWIAAWNAHDMDRILSHYADDFEMSSPLIVERLGLPGLSMRPALQFELIATYQSVRATT